jgi:sporulation protein YlmC with PRC-barrel domain
VKEPTIAAATPVVDNAGRRVGEVKGVELEPASGRITRILVREGTLFQRETPIPAGLIASVGDRITLSVSADEVKKLERPYVDEPGTVPAR